MYKKNPPKWSNNYNDKPIGLTGNNIEIDYLGLRSLIKPLKFLNLTCISQEFLYDKNLDFIKQKMEEGYYFGNPFLQIQIPNNWFKNKYSSEGFIKSSKFATVISHEGRHRILSSYLLYGNNPEEVHLFFVGENGQGIRKKNIDENFISNLYRGLYSEDFHDLIKNSIDKILI